ncbi:malonyl CoA-acyl carrier protein transacylase [Woeseia oceani]|uniref:Malonyl CoA-acyl carrier protein transacylase n=2 Tax=Woeseia oceani TaxID=1548547 RepID=A0A193LGB1_9GAMM|nr:malonyl CoA-acyl carrier protein transacylase [Woeseia oceani]
MQKALADTFTEVVETYAEASEVLGYDLWSLVQEGTPEDLDRTVVTQPAMLTAGVAAWRCWQQAGATMPAWMAGHSLGEYTALVAAGSLTFADALKLVAKRAEFMQQAVPEGSGAMAAILGLDDSAVVDVCSAAANGQVVSAVNFNSPGQVVIAGEKSAVERAVDGAKAAGAKRALLLRVSVPSHSALMQPAADALKPLLDAATVSAPSVPVLSNVDVAPYSDANQIRDGLRRQLYSPVRWSDTIKHMAANGVSVAIECGPGKVLAGLVKRIDREVTGVFIDDADSLQKALTLSGTGN